MDFSNSASTVLREQLPSMGKQLEIHEMPGHLIRRMNQIAVSVFDEKMKLEGIDLTPVQFAALSAIKASPGIDQASVAGEIAYDRVTIGGVLSRLEKKQFVERRTAPQDRRSRELFLTTEGREVLEKALPLVREVQDVILAGLEKRERQTFVELLAKATRHSNKLSRAPLLAGV